MNEIVRTLIFPVIGKPCEQYLDGLEEFQKIVEGNIEYVDLGHLTGFNELRDYDLFCNEEGYMKNLPMNRVFNNGIVLGNFIISKADEYGDQVSLTDEDISFIKRSMSIINNERID
jgi:hypothetical protein